MLKETMDRIQELEEVIDELREEVVVHEKQLNITFELIMDSVSRIHELEHCLWDKRRNLHYLLLNNIKKGEHNQESAPSR